LRAASPGLDWPPRPWLLHETQPAVIGRHFRRGNHQRLRAAPPQTVEHDIRAREEMWLERPRRAM